MLFYHLPLYSAVDKLMVFLLFFSQKIGINQGDSLHKIQFLFSGENKENISKCFLLRYLPNMLNVNTKKKRL